MAVFLRTVVTKVGPEAGDLLSEGVLILFADGAPPELAEISVLHAVAEGPSPEGPGPGAEIRIGELSAILTGVGSMAWQKVREIGHVVINFNGEEKTERPGELCASAVNSGELIAALSSGAEIVIAE